MNKDGQSILLKATQGQLCSEDRYKGKQVISVLDVALDVINDLEQEINRLNAIIRQIEGKN
ncbi:MULTISPECIES: hypothetical protein [Rahnella]|nr:MULTISPECIES: hypothetical protein [Rahnella]MBF7982032.1 hypothetical protein [Rahnella laticis]MBF8002122.1 hypothetical protein [Rahnella sp. LAC-M12]